MQSEEGGQNQSNPGGRVSEAEVADEAHIEANSNTLTDKSAAPTPVPVQENK